MRVLALASVHNNSKKNVSFGDDCGYVPSSYRYTNAIQDMKKRQYIIQGINTTDAFSRMYDDINATMNEAAMKPGGEWFTEGKTYTSKTQYTVHRWDMTKEKFAGMMTRFWNFARQSLSKGSGELADTFLTQSEGLKKPNFFQQFSSKFQEFVESKSVIRDVTDNFLKLGKHRLH